MAKSGIQKLASSRTDLLKIDPRKLQVREGWNSRDFDNPVNQAHVEALKNSIAEVGVLEPLTVVFEDGEAWVTNGESRLRAIWALIEAGHEIDVVKVQTEERGSDPTDHIASQIVRNSGKPLEPIEMAAAVGKLLKTGLTPAGIAGKVGLTPERVRQLLVLNGAPKAVKNMVNAGKVSATMAQRTLEKAKDGAAAAKKLREAVQTARAAGKDRASPKHLVDAPAGHKAPQRPRVNPRHVIAALLAGIRGVEEKDDEVVIRVPRAEWDALKGAAGDAPPPVAAE